MYVCTSDQQQKLTHIYLLHTTHTSLCMEDTECTVFFFFRRRRLSSFFFKKNLFTIFDPTKTYKLKTFFYTIFYTTYTYYIWVLHITSSM